MLNEEKISRNIGAISSQTNTNENTPSIVINTRAKVAWLITQKETIPQAMMRLRSNRLVNLLYKNATISCYYLFPYNHHL